MTCQPARLHGQRLHLHPPLSSSQIHSGLHCPASAQHLSSKWAYPATHTVSNNHSLSLSDMRTQTHKHTPHLNLLANIFSLCYEAEVVQLGFSWQKAHIPMIWRFQHTPLVGLLEAQQKKKTTHKYIMVFSFPERDNIWSEGLVPGLVGIFVSSQVQLLQIFQQLVLELSLKLSEYKC